MINSIMFPLTKDSKENQAIHDSHQIQKTVKRTCVNLNKHGYQFKPEFKTLEMDDVKVDHPILRNQKNTNNDNKDRKVVIYFPGNMMKMSEFHEACNVSNENPDIIVANYSKYGFMKGKYTRQDMVNYCREIYEDLLDQGYDPKNITFFGRSAGGHLASLALGQIYTKEKQLDQNYSGPNIVTVNTLTHPIHWVDAYAPKFIAKRVRGRYKNNQDFKLDAGEEWKKIPKDKRMAFSVENDEVIPENARPYKAINDRTTYRSRDHNSYNETHNTMLQQMIVYDQTGYGYQGALSMAQEMVDKGYSKNEYNLQMLNREEMNLDEQKVIFRQKGNALFSNEIERKLASHKQNVKNINEQELSSEQIGNLVQESRLIQTLLKDYDTELKYYNDLCLARYHFDKARKELSRYDSKFLKIFSSKSKDELVNNLKASKENLRIAERNYKRNALGKLRIIDKSPKEQIDQGRLIFAESQLNQANNDFINYRVNKSSDMFGFKKRRLENRKKYCQRKVEQAKLIVSNKSKKDSSMHMNGVENNFFEKDWINTNLTKKNHLLSSSSVSNFSSLNVNSSIVEMYNSRENINDHGNFSSLENKSIEDVSSIKAVLDEDDRDNIKFFDSKNNHVENFSIQQIDMFNNLINLISNSKLLHANLLIKLNNEDFNHVANNPQIGLSLRECAALKKAIDKYHIENKKPNDMHALIKYKKQAERNIKIIDKMIKKLNKSSENTLFEKYKVNKYNTIDNLKELRVQCKNISNTIETHINYNEPLNIQNK